MVVLTFLSYIKLGHTRKTCNVVCSFSIRFIAKYGTHQLILLVVLSLRAFRIREHTCDWFIKHFREDRETCPKCVYV